MPDYAKRYENWEVTKDIRISQEETYTVTLDLWNIPPHEEFERIRFLGYRNTDIFLVCFDLSNMQSFKHLSERWRPELDHYCKDATKILVGLKSELEIDSEWMDNNDILVYGYINSLDHLGLHIINDIIRIILSYFASTKDVDIGNEMTNGNYAKYMEVSSLKKRNVEEVFTNAVIEFLAPEYNPVKPNRGDCCSVL